jgi:hypothetical protein
VASCRLGVGGRVRGDKQHYVVDIPAGATLGWMAFSVYRSVA